MNSLSKEEQEEEEEEKKKKKWRKKSRICILVRHKREDSQSTKLII